MRASPPRGRRPGRSRPRGGSVPAASIASGAALALIAGLLAPSGVEAQEEGAERDTAARDTAAAPVAPAAGPPRARCDLVFQPASEDTESQSVASPGGGYVTHVRGGMIWTCGNATMEADSAVRYDAARRVELIGDVDYRDTIRTLRSRRLDYFEIGDRVIATGDVRLTRLASGSTLEGPRVEFLRAVSGVGQLTVATGRPHMTLHAEGEGAGPAPPEAAAPPGEAAAGGAGAPFEVDADRAVFAGEEVAWASGDVVIDRPDLRATADSAFFRVEEGVGQLFGDPVASGETFRLSGDSLRIAFDDRRLREVRAMGGARAVGEDFQVLGEQLTIRIHEDLVEAVWAHGEGRSMAVSSRYRLYGDSLRFAMTEGRIDTVIAVGRTAAVEDSSPVVPVPDAAVPDTAPSPEARAAAADSVAAPAPEAAAAAPGRAEPGDTAAAAVAAVDTAGADSLVRRSEDGAAAARSRRIPEPRLDVDADANWVSGDTLYAVFEPVPGVPTAGADTDTIGEDTAGPDAVVADGGEGRSRTRMRQLRVVGDARSFYAAARDTARTRRLSRNYLIGRRIDVHFRDGEADRVVGTEAIGLYLDPLEGGAEGAGELRGAGPDTTPIEPDTTPVPSDTTPVPPDTTEVPPDMEVRPDTAAPPEGRAAPSDAPAPPEGRAAPSDAPAPAHRPVPPRNPAGRRGGEA